MSAEAPLLETRRLSKHFDVTSGLLSRIVHNLAVNAIRGPAKHERFELTVAFASLVPIILDDATDRVAGLSVQRIDALCPSCKHNGPPLHPMMSCSASCAFRFR